jgi:hypothetical protein
LRTLNQVADFSNDRKHYFSTNNKIDTILRKEFNEKCKINYVDSVIIEIKYYIYGSNEVEAVFTENKHYKVPLGSPTHNTADLMEFYYKNFTIYGRE